MSRPDFAPQCFSYSDLELELVSVCEDTDWDGNQDVYQYQVTMDETNGDVSVVHPKFVGRPIKSNEAGCPRTRPTIVTKEWTFQTTNGHRSIRLHRPGLPRIMAGKWCYSDVNRAVGCTASPKECWEKCARCRQHVRPFTCRVPRVRTELILPGRLLE